VNVKQPEQLIVQRPENTGAYLENRQSGPHFVQSDITAFQPPEGPGLVILMLIAFETGAKPSQMHLTAL
jgi:hypothetical protein